MSSTYKPTSPLDPTYVQQLYIPSAVLLFFTFVLAKSLVPFTVGLIAVYAAYLFYNNQVRKILNPNEFAQFPLVEKIPLSHNTAVYRFGLPSPTSVLGLPTGQHISIAAELDVADPKNPGTTTRREVLRSYTPITDDTTPGHFDLLIKSYPTGNISRHVANLKIGDNLRIKGPKGAMAYEKNMVKSFGMIAGGTGITPMYQIAKAVARGRKSGDVTEVSLIFTNVNEEDILMRDELDKLARTDPRFSVYYVLNNPPENWTGGTGFVTPDMIKTHLPSPSADTKLLICGPPPMVSAMKKAAEGLGYEKARPVSKLEDQVFCF